MARQKAIAQATTLYRLRHTDELKDAVKKKYRENSTFAQDACTVKDRDALLIVGSIGGNEPVKWAARVKTLTGTVVEVSNETAAGVLLLRLDDRPDAATWALCWGMGWLLLDQGLVDGAFGQRLALRSADPDLLSSLTRTVLDERAKVDRSSIPAGSGLTGFGIGGFGELVTRVVGKAEIKGLTIGKEFRVRGADAVSVPLGLTPATLLADLKVLDDLLTQDPRPELQVLEQLVPVKKGTDVHERLETRLLYELQQAPDTSKIMVTWPHEHLNENKPAESFRVKGGGGTQPRADLPTKELVLQLLSGRDIASLDRIKIQLFGDAEGEDAVSSDIPLRKWVALEIEEGGRRYFLHDGQWFAMDLDYAKQLDQRVKGIFAKSSGVTMPEWHVPDDEEAYNKKAAEVMGAVLMDRKLVQTAQNKRGFEPSDLIIESDVYVHVKSATSSAPLSHLFAQGANSAHALQHDEEARMKLRDRVQQRGGDRDLIGNKPRRVIYAIRPKEVGKSITPDDLFSFSKVSLVRAFDELESRGIEVRVTTIGYLPE
ncbi:TIGR04141 family sporadically distributed protein [Microbacterium kribbense]|uniref:TIGR04141 family sporadically distributed protein n=1 Tax=Microbacterium kribbense TaxID=433645 RepID=A0ABP7GDI3_9MICO